MKITVIILKSMDYGTLKLTLTNYTDCVNIFYEIVAISTIPLF